MGVGGLGDPLARRGKLLVDVGVVALVEGADALDGGRLGLFVAGDVGVSLHVVRRVCTTESVLDHCSDLLL